MTVCAVVTTIIVVVLILMILVGTNLGLVMWVMKLSMGLLRCLNFSYTVLVTVMATAVRCCNLILRNQSINVVKYKYLEIF